MIQERKISLLLVACLTLLGEGCASVKPMRGQHRGFFDRLSDAGSRGRLNRSLASSDDPQAFEETARLAEFVKAEMKLMWPLKNVTVTSTFGRRNDGYHEGIDLRASPGTAVHASADGTVLYADRRIRGYGKMVVLRHLNGISTVYGHNSKLLVRKGQRVRAGQRIAISGNTGRSTGPHLHFEIRSGITPLDPLYVLSTRGVAFIDSEHERHLAQKEIARR